MRVMAIVLAGTLAICAADSAFAAKKKNRHVEPRSDQYATYAAQYRVPEPNAGAGIGTNFLSSGCGIAGCYRSGSQKIQHHHKSS
jgi:hypothetical protein